MRRLLLPVLLLLLLRLLAWGRLLLHLLPARLLLLLAHVLPVQLLRRQRRRLRERVLLRLLPARLLLRRLRLLCMAGPPPLLVLARLLRLPPGALRLRRGLRPRLLRRLLRGLRLVGLPAAHALLLRRLLGRGLLVPPLRTATVTRGKGVFSVSHIRLRMPWIRHMQRLNKRMAAHAMDQAPRARVAAALSETAQRLLSKATPSFWVSDPSRELCHVTRSYADCGQHTCCCGGGCAGCWCTCCGCGAGVSGAGAAASDCGTSREAAPGSASSMAAAASGVRCSGESAAPAGLLPELAGAAWDVSVSGRVAFKAYRGNSLGTFLLSSLPRQVEKQAWV